jgi:outer membrane protein assembly factor BamB
MLRALVLLVFCSGAAAAADWPQWLGPRRDGGTSEKIEPWTTPPKAAWTVKTGVGFSSPVVANGKVFVHARVNGKEKEEMIAIDAASGKVLWRTPYDRTPYSSVLNTGPQATPAVAGGKIYGFGITGSLTCFDAETGNLDWHVDALKKLKVNVPRFGVCCSPLVIGNRVIVAVGGKGSAVVAFDTKTGDIAWQGLDEAANTSSPVLYAVKGKPVPDAVFMTTLRVIGLNPLDGTVNWEYPLPFQPGGTSPTPLVNGDTIITSTMDNGTNAFRLKGTDKLETEKAWQTKGVSGYFSSGVASKDRIFLVTNTLKPVPRADLACLDATTGKLKWKKEGIGYFHFGVVRTGNGKLLLLDDKGTMRLVNAEADEYKELCSASVCEGTLVVPTISNGMVFARDGEKVVGISFGK